MKQLVKVQMPVDTARARLTGKMYIGTGPIMIYGEGATNPVMVTKEQDPELWNRMAHIECGGQGSMKSYFMAQWDNEIQSWIIDYNSGAQRFPSWDKQDYSKLILVKLHTGK